MRRRDGRRSEAAGWLLLRRPRASLLCDTALRAAAARAAAGVPLLLAPLAPALAQPAPNARPQGGVVVGGSARIGGDATTTVIDQSSGRAAINWQSFDVGAQQSVRFNQPSNTAVTLNQVVGPDPSQIAGRISANGQVILTNRAGVVFHDGAQVNAQSLVVSAAAANPAAFMAGGKVAFDRAPLPGAVVENRGHITVAQEGLAALVAPAVRNSGVISAKLGHVVLAGSDRHVLDMYGDGLLSIDVTGQVRTAPGGGGAALVTNTGTVLAEGGSVVLTARAADGVVQTLVDAGGTVSAPSLPGHPGRVVISGTGGALSVSGAVLAEGAAPGTTGGSVAVVGPGAVQVAATARISASGPAGGGVVALGTTLARARGGAAVSPRVTASRVAVARGATVSADATAGGRGGRVVLLSTGTTSLSGRLTARGGPAGGDGGLVEVSGTRVSLDGATDTTAPRGRAGSTLLDPYDLVISTDGSATSSGTVVAYDDSSGNSTLTPASIAALSGGVTLQAQHDLSVLSSLTLTGGITTLELDAGHSLFVNAPISMTGAGMSGVPLVLTAAGAAVGYEGSVADAVLSVAAPISTVGPITLAVGGAGAIAVNAAVSAGAVGDSGAITAMGSPVTLSAGTGSITLGGVIGASSLVLSTEGDVAETASGGISASSLSGSAIAVSLAGGNNAVAAIGTLVAQSLVLVQPSALTVDTLAVAGTAQLSTGDLTVGTLSLGQGSSTLAATGSLSLLGPVSLPTGGGTLGLSSTGDMVLGSSLLGTADFGGLIARAGGALSETGGIDMTAATLAGVPTVLSAGLGLTVAGPISTAGPLSLAAGPNSPLEVFAPVAAGTISGSGSFVAAGSPLTLAAGSGGVLLGTGVAASTLTLATTGAVTETGSGALTATSLGGSAGDVSLTSSLNAVSAIGSLSASSFALTQPGTLVVGTLDAGGGAVTLGTGDVTVAGLLRAGSLTLQGSGSVTEQPSGSVTAASLDGRLSGILSLEGTANAVSAIGSLSVGALMLDQAGALSVGTLTALQVQLATGDLTVNGLSLEPSLGASTLAATGTLSLLGPVNLPALGGGLLLSSTGDMHLSAPLTSTTQGGVLQAMAGGTLTEDGGIRLSAEGLSLTAGADLLVRGAISSSGVVLLAAGGGGTLALSAPVSTSGALSLGGGTVVVGAPVVASTLGLGGAGGLGSAGTASETGAGAVTATSLGGTVGALAFGGAGNAVGTLGAAGAPLVATAGPLSFREGAGLTLTLGSLAVPSGGTIALAADALGGGSVTPRVPGGELALSAATTGRPESLVGSVSGAAGTLEVPVGVLAASGAATLRLGDGTGPVTVAPDGVAVRLPGTATLALDGSSVSQGGALAVGTLSLATAGDAVLDAAGNAVGALGASPVGGTLLLTDSGSLAVAGPVTATAVRLASGGTLSVPGTLSASADATLQADRVSFGGGRVAAGGTVTLLPLTAGLDVALSASAPAGVLGLGQADLDAIAAPVLALRTGGAVTVGQSASDVADLSGRASELLVSAGGTLGGPGALVVGTLAGDASSVSLSGMNRVGTLGAFTATGGGLALSSDALVAAGPVVADGPLSLSTRNGPLELAGTLRAPTVSLAASGGAVVEDPGGALLSGRLDVSASAVSLTAVGNQVGTLGTVRADAFSLATAGDLAVAGTVTVGGIASLSANGILSEAGGVLDVGTLSLAATAATLGAANTITALGTVTTGELLLTDTGALTVGGPLDVGGTARLSVGGGLALSGPAFSAGTLALSVTGPVTGGGAALSVGSITGTAGSLSLTALSPTLGALAVTGPLQLDARTGLAVSGPVTADTVALSSGGALTVGGPLAATGVLSLAAVDAVSEPGGSLAASELRVSGAAVQLGGGGNTVTVLGPSGSGAGGFALTDSGALTVSGPLAAGGPASLATRGALVLSGAVSAPTLALLSGGDVSGGGLERVGTLSGSARSVSLSGSVATLGSLGTAAGLSLSDSGPLTVAGPLTDPTAIALSATGPLTVAGTVTAPGVSLASGGGGAADGIALAGGAVTATGALSLRTDGAVTQTGGGLLAGTLTGGVGGASLAGAVGTLGALTAGTLSLLDAVPLVVAGPLTVGTLGLTDASGITLAGTLSLGAATLTGGAVRQVSGLFQAGTLSGSANGVATFGPDDPGPVAAIGTLAGFSVTGGTLSLVDSVPLRVTGTVSAAELLLSAPGTLALSDLSLRTGALSPASAQTGGSGGAVSPGAVLAVQPDAGGAARLLQSGTMTVAPVDGASTATVRLVLPQGGGQASLAALSAPAATLVLVPGGGSVTGSVAVGGLLVLGGAGSVTLTGSVGGLNGAAAAGAGSVSPLPAPAYALNGCEIGLACLVAPTLPPQVAPDGSIGIVVSTPAAIIAALQAATEGGLLAVTAQDVLRPDRTLNGILSLSIVPDVTDPDLLLPNISDQDY